MKSSNAKHNVESNYNLLAPVLAGIAIGLLFILIIFFSLVNLPTQIELEPPTLAVVTDENRAFFNEIIEKSRQVELVSTFLSKYPNAKTDIVYYQDAVPIYSTEDTESVVGYKQQATVVYFGTTITRIEYENRETQSSQPVISYHQPTLWIPIDSNGNVGEIEFRCASTYLDSIAHFGQTRRNLTLEKDHDVIMDLLRSTPC